MKKTLLGLLLSTAATLAADGVPVVRVNEIMASNGTTLLTADGDAADWIELYNPGTEAADISGWRLSDKTGSKAWSKGETLPEGTIVPAGGYLVVFADDYTGWTNGEVHVALGFSSDGEAVSLLSSEDNVVSSFEFPPQLKDVSYGYGRPRDPIVGDGSPAEMRVGGTGAWTSITGSVGFCSEAGLFTCTQYNSKSTVNNLDDARACVRDSSKWNGTPVTKSCQTVNFSDGSSGSFSATAFPGNSSTSQGRDNFVVVATGAILVPSAGQWSFAVGSDDGFALSITGHGQSFSSEFNTGRSHAQTVSVFNFPEAGAYNVELVFFEISGGASLEFSAAQGNIKDFSSSTFRLVGADDCLVRHAGAFAPYIRNDVESVMRGVSSTLDWRSTFHFDGTPSEADTLELCIRYVDGFVATLNGVEVARSNAPSPTDRSATGASESSFLLPATSLVQGDNTLVITGYNNTVSDPNFLLSPALYYSTAAESLVYFRAPTPGSANTTTPSNPMTPEIVFSEPRGYKTGPISVALSCPAAPNADIYYTTDGTSPTTSNGTRYNGPIAISSTTILRAAVPDPASLLQVDSTASYFFLSDILLQDSATPTGFPSNGAVNGQAMRYGMRGDIVNGADRERLLNGFTNSICTLSIVCDPGNLFNAQTGIYVNASNDGRGWERLVSVEQIDPVHGAENEFQIPAGIRIRGAYSRSSGTAKHSLRLFFRSDYGSGALQFPLFGDEGADRFEKVDLRTSQNYSWANENSGGDNFIHELFSRDTQRDMGQPYTRTRYYNLFLNGIYWGLYQTQERGDADYAETYLGGDADDWDCIKTSQPGYVTTAADGTFDAYYALWDIAVNQGFAGSYSDNYYRVLGRNPDGSRNLAYPVYVNPTNLMDFVIDAHFAADGDSPISLNNTGPNNLYALCNRTADGTGFVWLRHDAEHSLGLRDGVTVDNVLWGTELNNTTYKERSKFNPIELHYKLLDNPEYHLTFADRVQKHCFGDGALTPENAAARFRSRQAEITDAIVCELARWGRSHTYTEWQNRCDSIVNNFLRKRTDYLVAHYRTHGWFPSIDAPAATRYSGSLNRNEEFALSADRQFYYTTDGSDPRAADGTASPTALSSDAPSPYVPAVSLVLSPRNGTWLYYDWGNEPSASNGKTWRDPGFDDASWASGRGIFGFAGNNGTNPIGCQTHRYINHGNSGTQVMTTYFRRTFTLPAGSGAETITKLTGSVLFDDGYALYLNGTKIHRDNLDDNATYSSGCGTIGDPDQTTYFAREITIPAGLLHDGENVLAVELHQCHGTSTDLYFDLSLEAILSPEVPAGTIRATVDVGLYPVHVLARAYDSTTGEWSALTDVTVDNPAAVDFAEPADALRVAEVLSVSADAEGDGAEYIVLTNLSATAYINLAGTRLTCAKVGKAPSLDLNLPAIYLHPGASLTLTKDEHWPDAKITNGKVDGLLYDASGAVIQTFYLDSDWWNGICDGSGASFIALDFSDSVTAQSQWRPSTSVFLGNIAIAELMTSTADAAGDGAEYIVLTNLIADASLDVSSLRLVFAKDAEGAVPTCDITLPAGTVIAAGGTLTLCHEDFVDIGWAKITNGKVNGSIYDENGILVQLVHINANWWNGACDGTGASFVAQEFSENVTSQDQWRPTAADFAGKLAVAELMSISIDRGPNSAYDGSEYIVLTNLSTEVELDLAGVRIAFAETLSGKESEPTCDITLPAGLSIPEGGSITLRRTDFADAGWTKITNNKINGYVYDAAGSLLQTVHTEVGWWKRACAGTGASYIALEFGPVVTNIVQWTPSFLPPSDTTALSLVKALGRADEAWRLWFVAQGSDPVRRAALESFTGTQEDLEFSRRLDVPAATPADIDLILSAIALDEASDTVTLSADLLYKGTPVTANVNGTVQLVRSEILHGPATTNALDQTAFPLTVEGLPASADSAFYRLLIE